MRFMRRFYRCEIYNGEVILITSVPNFLMLHCVVVTLRFCTAFYAGQLLSATGQDIISAPFGEGKTFNAIALTNLDAFNCAERD